MGDAGRRASQSHGGEKPEPRRPWLIPFLFSSPTGPPPDRAKDPVGFEAANFASAIARRAAQYADLLFAIGIGVIVAAIAVLVGVAALAVSIAVAPERFPPAAITAISGGTAGGAIGLSVAALRASHPRKKGGRRPGKRR